MYSSYRIRLTLIPIAHFYLTLQKFKFLRKFRFTFVFFSLSQIGEHFVYWADQGVSHCRKRCVMDEFKLNGDKRKYFHGCRERFASKLDHLYGGVRVEKPLRDIVNGQSLALRTFLIENAIGLGFYTSESVKLLSRMEELVPDKRKFTQLLQEEIELEIEMEQEEEMEVQRPQRADPYTNTLDEDVRRLVVDGHFRSDSASFLSLGDNLARTSLAAHREWNAAWTPLVKVTRDFTQTVYTRHMSDDFLASPRWIVHVPTVAPSLIQFLVLSDYEANALWPHFVASSSLKDVRRAAANRLYLFSPRMRYGQERMFDVHTMTPVVSHWQPPIELLLEQLAIFAGSLYFNEKSELDNYLNIVGYCPSPRTPHLTQCFDQHLIEVSGFVKPKNRPEVFGRGTSSSSCPYKTDPCECIVKLLGIRHFGIVPQTSHQLDVLLRGRRPHIFIE